MQKTIVSHPAKTFGQDVLQEQPQEIFALDDAVAGLAGPAFDVLKSNMAILIGDDIIFTNDAPV